MNSDKMSRNVLVCNHDRQVSAQLRSHLRQLGWEVTCTWSGADALGEINGGQYELMILGAGISDLDGRELTRRIRENPSTQTAFIVVLLDQVDPELIFHTYLDGADLVLTKPLDLGTLSSLLPEE